MAVSVQVGMKFRITETLTQDGASSPKIIYDAYGISSETWEAGTANHPVTKVSVDSVPLVAGAKTIDLSALVGTNGAAVDGTGLKVQGVWLENPSTNTGKMTFVEGASNGYRLMDDASWRIVLKPGQKTMIDLYDTSPDVAAADKTIDVTGTGTESFRMQVILG